MAKKTQKKTTRKQAKKSKKKPASPKIELKPLSVPCMHFTQAGLDMYFFVVSAKELWKYVDVNRRTEDKTLGYQRAFSESRVRKVAKFIDEKNAIPGSILIAFEHGLPNKTKTKFTIDANEHAGWVIDGQHRLIGASVADNDIDIPVIGLVDLDWNKQIDFFVTINREQKGVPSSLYLDLLQHLPNKKSEKEIIEERTNDLASVMKKDPSSPFYQRIVATTAPKKGQISTTNFVRKVGPLIKPNGPLADFPDDDRAALLNNYYKALKISFPKLYNESNSIFFRTIGFGALMQALSSVMNLTLQLAKSNSLRTQDIQKALDYVSDLETVFDAWNEMGTGTAAENLAARDMREKLKDASNAAGSIYKF